MNAEPNSSRSHSGSSHLMPSSIGCTRHRSRGASITAPTIPAGSARRGDRSTRDVAGWTERAPYDPMPHGPPEVGVGPWVGPLPDRRASTTRSCSPRATGATSSTATATGRWRRSSPTSTPAGTTSTSRSRTGSTTSTSARSSARPTRSWPREVHIVGNRRWNRRGAMVTDRYQHVRHHPDVADLAAYLHEQGVALLGIDNLPGSLHLETTSLPRRVLPPLRPGGSRALRRGARGVRRDVLDRAVRLDPLDQRLRGRRDRDARLDPRSTPTCPTRTPGGADLVGQRLVFV